MEFPNSPQNTKATSSPIPPHITITITITITMTITTVALPARSSVPVNMVQQRDSDREELDSGALGNAKFHDAGGAHPLK
jgi:hypothetical protein